VIGIGEGLDDDDDDDIIFHPRAVDGEEAVAVANLGRTTDADAETRLRRPLRRIALEPLEGVMLSRVKQVTPGGAGCHLGGKKGRSESMRAVVFRNENVDGSTSRLNKV
jgi:hypothetical protein